MTPLAALLAGVGVAHLVRRWRQVLAVVAVVALCLLTGAGWHTAWIAPVCLLVVVVWLDAAAHDSRAGTILLTTVAVAFVVASPAFDAAGAPLQGWYDDLPVAGLAAVPLDRAALGLGVLLFLTSAANVVVRQALEATGPHVLEEERSLRGGRLLGPMERWLVFAFALSGNPGALGALVAAKGILRFPEISQDSKDGMRAEYVLVGSFVSWTLALLFVPLF